jgi:hypothetical protein
VLEVLIALGVFAALGGLVLLTLVPPLTLAWVSLALTLLGFFVGVPTGVYYHVALRRELLGLGALPHGWYWHPTRYHEQLGASALARVMPWFFIGAFGFLLTVTGFVIGVVMFLKLR